MSPKTPKVILVVEDENTVRSLIQLFLAKGQHTIIEATNGLEGIGLAKSMGPDLIITDLMMPVMSGVELIRELKKDEKTKHIPIICISGASFTDQREASLAGAAAVLSKPLHYKEFSALVASLLA